MRVPYGAAAKRQQKREEEHTRMTQIQESTDKIRRYFWNGGNDDHVMNRLYRLKETNYSEIKEPLQQLVDLGARDWFEDTKYDELCITAFSLLSVNELKDILGNSERSKQFMKYSQYFKYLKPQQLDPIFEHDWVPSFLDSELKKALREQYNENKKPSIYLGRT